MTPSQPTVPPSPSLSLSDITYIVFRHKWKILVCTLLGLVGAGVAYKLRKPTFQSDAKLYIRYVLSDQQMSPLGTNKDNAKSPDQRGETIMSSEMEILTSADLATQVAQAVGPEKILAKLGGGKDPVLAAEAIRKGLSVDVPYRSSVIHISFKHPDSDIVQPVLRQLVDSYLKMHRDVHQALGISGDFITQETDQLRARLEQTEQELQKVRTKAGIYSSVEDAKKMYADQIGAVRLQLLTVQADLAARLSALKPPATPAKTDTSATPAKTDAPATAAATATPAPTAEPAQPETPKAKIDEYGALVARIDAMNKAQNQLLLQYTPENPRVAEIRAQITAAEAQRHKLEQDFPVLARARTAPANAATPGVAAAQPADPAADIAALQARVSVLNAQLQQLTSDAAKVADVEVAVAELRRRRDMDEANYRRFAERLEEIRLDDSAGAGRVSNISVVESPTFPAIDAGKAGKVIGGIAVSGLALGLAWALAIELYLDRSIKRPVDVERNFRIPLFLCLPEMKRLPGKGRRGKSSTRALADKGGETATSDSTALAAAGNPLGVYHETLRDRLTGFFESINLTHKPKLVAVTSVGKSAGVTTTASGLAQSLSEIGEGNVLLVDMTAGHGSAQQFLKGKPVSDLDDMLDAREGGHVQENLYVVTADSKSEKLSKNLPQRFTKLVPKLKASDFDYIIFDLPPVSQISITPRLAGFMDMVLLVIESEKTDRELLHRATKLLAQSKTNVGAVLNRTRNYGPSQHQTEFLYGM